MASACVHNIVDDVCVRCTLDRVTLPMLQWPEEVVKFGEWMLQHRIRNVLEIGTGPGGMTMFIGALATGRIVSIDLPHGSSSGLPLAACQLRNDMLKQANSQFFGVIGDSHAEDVRSIVLDLVREVDLLFIDGDHSYSGLVNDVCDYQLLIRPGGWVAFHDINAQKFERDGVDVPRFWNELKIGAKEVISVDGDWGGIGILQT